MTTCLNRQVVQTNFSQFSALTRKNLHKKAGRPDKRSRVLLFVSCVVLSFLYILPISFVHNLDNHGLQQRYMYMNQLLRVLTRRHTGRGCKAPIHSERLFSTLNAGCYGSHRSS
jgi:hypothetical protein